MSATHTDTGEHVMGNITITLSAEYAAQAVADLKELRAGDPAMRRYTPAVSVVLLRLEDALMDAAPSPEFTARRAEDARTA